MTEKPLETIGDVNAALKHLGWETVDDLHCWAISNDIERFEQLAQAFATHRTEAVAALEARVRELERYTKHDGLCGIIGGYDRCTCGLAATRKALHDPR